MLDGSVGLIAVPWSQLLKDGCTDLLEAKLKNFCLNCCNDQCIVDLDVVEVEIGNVQRDGPIVQARLKDLSAYLHQSEHAEVAGTEPCGKAVTHTIAVDHNPSCLG
jgi:hypothetical protein